MGVGRNNDNNLDGARPSHGTERDGRPSDAREQRCWLCGRAVRPRIQADGIPVHRECLEDGRKCYEAGTPLTEPDDVIYLSATLFRT